MQETRSLVRDEKRRGSQSRYDAGQCWEVPTDLVHRGQVLARGAGQQDPRQPRYKGVRRRHSLGSRGTKQVSSDREDVRVVLRSGRVSDNMAVFLSYTTEDR